MTSPDSTLPIQQAVRTAGQGEVLALDWGRILWTASRSLGNSTTTTFGRVTIYADQANPIHRHPNCDEILHVLSGRISHTLGDEQLDMGPGDTISIPAGVWHNAKALGGVDAEMVICFSSADRETESPDASPA